MPPIPSPKTAMDMNIKCMLEGIKSNGPSHDIT